MYLSPWSVWIVNELILLSLDLVKSLPSPYWVVESKFTPIFYDLYM